MLSDPLIKQAVFQAFPFLAQAPADVQAQFFQSAARVALPAGQFICLEGSQCTQLALVLSGNARVYKLGESGREITLYRVEAGESCILTASCILSQVAFPAFAVAETDIEAVTIPSSLIRQWVNQYQAWRDYAFRLLSERLANIIAVVEEIAFRRVDERLAEYLLRLVSPSHSLIEKTHQDIATDLGTSREVISRILKEFEREGVVALTRGQIQILDLIRLQQKS